MNAAEKVTKISSCGGAPRPSGSGGENAVPGVGDGWAVLRFRVPGAGVYAMHCHIDLHQEVGMVLYFAIRDAGAKDGGWKTPADMDCRRAARGRVDRGGGVDVRPFDAY